MTTLLLHTALKRRAEWLRGVASRIERDDVADVVRLIGDRTAAEAARHRWPSGASRHRLADVDRPAMG